MNHQKKFCINSSTFTEVGTSSPAVIAKTKGKRKREEEDMSAGMSFCHIRLDLPNNRLSAKFIGG